MTSRTKNVLKAASVKGEARQLSNGVTLGGVWKDYHDIFVALREKEQRLEEEVGLLTEDRDSLIYERISLFEKWKLDMASLTEAETSHFEAQQLIDHVRGEQKVLQSKVLSLEAQRMWLEKEREDLRSQCSCASNNVNELCDQLARLQSQLDTEKEETSALQDLLYKRDETIESLKVAAQKRDEEIDVLRKSVVTKDRQFQTLIKERDRIRHDLDIANKQLARPKPLHRSSSAPRDSRRPYASKYSSDEESSSSEVEDVGDVDYVGTKESTYLTPEKISTPSTSAAFAISSEGRADYYASATSTSTPVDIATLLVGDIDASRQRFEIKERQYQAIIRKLQQNLIAAKSATAANSRNSSMKDTPTPRTAPRSGGSARSQVVHTDRSTPVRKYDSKASPSSSSSLLRSGTSNANTPLASYSRTHNYVRTQNQNQNQTSSDAVASTSFINTPKKTLFPKSPDVSINKTSPSVSILMSPPRSSKSAGDVISPSTTPYSRENTYDRSSKSIVGGMTSESRSVTDRMATDEKPVMTPVNRTKKTA
jgi:hypothetical protein